MKVAWRESHQAHGGVGRGREEEPDCCRVARSVPGAGEDERDTGGGEQEEEPPGDAFSGLTGRPEQRR